MSLIQVLFRNFDPPPTSENAGIKPAPLKGVDFNAVAKNLKQLKEERSERFLG